MTNFFRDLVRLLRWSLFQPTQLTAYLSTLHPDLVHYAGLSRQLWLAGRCAAARRLLGWQLVAWSLGAAGSVLLILIQMFRPTSPGGLEIVSTLAIGLIGSLVLGLTGSLSGDISFGITLSLIGGMTLGLCLGVAFMSGWGGLVFSLAFAVTSGLSLGTYSATFDHQHRRAAGLWSINYWGQALVGVIFTAVIVVLLALLLTLVVNRFSYPLDLKNQVMVGMAFGLLGGLALSLAFTLEMFIEERRLHPRALRWILLDNLLLGLIGGAAGGLTVGLSSAFNIATLIIFWAVLTAGGGAMALRMGNGLSAILTAAGLAWLLAASPSAPFALQTLLIVVITLLTGFYGYLRLTIYLVEAPFTAWAYRQALRHPGQALLWLQRAPVYWDDLIFYPLPLLDRFLLLTLRADRVGGLQAVDFVAHTFRQGWAANSARLAYAAETLTRCDSPAVIAAAPTELDWLADEVMVTLKQGAGEIVPRLLAIAAGVRVTLSADNPYSRRLGYREALDGLDALRRRLPSLGPPAGRRWQPVIDRWQRVLLNELEAISTNTTVTVIENPYQPGTPLPLSRQELFKGRRELRDTVVNALLERHRPTLILCGPRRMGKTSFLLQLPALLPGHTLPVFLDLQRPTATQSTAAFLYSIARAISHDARPYRLLVNAPQRAAFDAAPFETFADWLEDIALPALQDFNLLLTFDEFEKLGEAVNAQRLDARIFDELRYLIQHQTRLALLFAGVQSLDELGPDWSSYFINAKPLTIGYLNPAEAAELICRPDLSADFKLVYASEVVKRIMAETCCHPYLLQLVCSAVVEESNARAALHVDLPLLNAALVRALNQGEPYFHNIWLEMAGPDGQPWLHQIAHAGAPLLLPNNPALTRLARRRIITQTAAGYTIEVPLVQKWLVERAMIN